jgi:cystathionine beta-lyase/cystathionine gamma-synthase
LGLSAILRISIGLEDPGDLWNDLDGMLRSIDCTDTAAASA